LIFKQQLRLKQQTPDQGTFAVVNASAGDKTQQAFTLVGFQITLNIVSNQVR